MKTTTKSKVHALSIPDLSARKIVSEIFAYQRGISALENIPAELRKAQKIWQNVDIRKISKDQIDKKIEGTMKLVQSYFAKIDPEGLYLKKLSPNGDFAQNMKLYSASSGLILQSTMQAFCECAIIISHLTDEQKRLMAFFEFPPTILDLNCLGGTGERIHEVITKLRTTDEQKFILNLHETSLVEAVDLLKYQVGFGNQVHIISYLRYVLSLESSNVIKATDHNYLIPQADISAQNMWTVLRKYPHQFSDDINEYLERIREVILNPENQDKIKKIFDVANNPDGTSYSESELKKWTQDLDILLSPLTIDDFRALNENKEYALIPLNKLDDTIIDALLNKLPELKALLEEAKKAKEEGVSNNAHNIEAIQDYAVLISDKAKDHLLPLLESNSENDRLIAIEALWVLGENLKGNSPFQFMQLLKEIAEKVNLPQVESRKSTSDQGQITKISTTKSKLQDWFIGLNKMFLPQKFMALIEDKNPQDNNQNNSDKIDIVHRFISDLRTITSKEHKFRLQKIIDRYDHYQQESHKYSGFDPKNIDLKGLLKHTFSADRIIQRIRQYPIEIKSLTTESEQLVVHPERMRILKALEPNMKDLKQDFIDKLLTFAAKYNDTELCKYVIENLVSDEMRNAAGDSNKVDYLKGILSKALPSVAEKGNLELLELFVDKGADLNRVDENGNTPLIISVREGHVNFTKALLKYQKDSTDGSRSVNINARNEKSYEDMARIAEKMKPFYIELIEAVETKQLKKIKLLFDTGVERRLLNDEECNTIITAVSNNNLDMAKYLIELAKETRLEEMKINCTALMIAAIHGRVDEIKLLLEHGADPNLLHDRGLDAFMLAVSYGQANAVKAFIESGKIDQKICADKGFSPLMIAIHKGHIDVVKELLTDQIDVNYLCKTNGYTAIMLAASFGDKTSVNMLLKKGADPNIPNPKDGYTPLMKAATGGHINTVKALLAGGADPSVVLQGNFTAFDLATTKEIKAILQPIKNLQDAVDLIPSLKGKISVRAYEAEDGKLKPFLVAKNPNDNVLQLLNEAKQTFIGKRPENKRLFNVLTGQESIEVGWEDFAKIKITTAFTDESLVKSTSGWSMARLGMSMIPESLVRS